MTARIELVTTSGIFSIDGEDFEVENNIWLLGDDHEVLVIDAAHDAGPIVAAIGDRAVRAIVCTHGHNDHINATDALSRATGGAPVLLHPADEMLWDVVYPDRKPDDAIREGSELEVAGTRLRVLHTPGHSPGGVCLVGPDGHVFGGDTLFKGGPGATGRSNSDFPTIIESIRDRLLVLPPDTVVHTGHGDTTTIGDEAPHLDEWIARGH
ncbi:MAG: MBL fold metallo-hydrolase [Acidimicrobiia bacterium]|nr:MBL fold metallo-hydrolase [Acidimicrobiia bacterium]